MTAVYVAGIHNARCSDADKAIMVCEQAASEALALGTRATETASSTAIAAVRMTFAKLVL